MDEGLSFRKIGEIFGCCHKTIIRFAKRNNLAANTVTPDTTKQQFDDFDCENEIYKIVSTAYYEQIFLKRSDAKLKKLSPYIRKTYGGLIQYFEINKIYHIIDRISLECCTCGRYKNLMDFGKNKGFLGVYSSCRNCTNSKCLKFYWDNHEKQKEKTRQWQKDNKDKVKINYHNRLAMEKALPHTLTIGQLAEITRFSNEKCYVSDSNITALDHFIPLAWGHGGTIYENMILLDAELNNSKLDRNPITWQRQTRYKRRIDDNKWNAMLSELASRNNVTVGEYIEFIFWCECNKRTVEQARSDTRSSIQIWKESKLT